MFQISLSRTSVNVFYGLSIGLIAGLASLPLLGTAQAQKGRLLDASCVGNVTCSGLLMPNSSCSSGVCVGSTTSATFSTCISYPNNICNYDVSQYGSVYCPGICQGTTGTKCGVNLDGCQ